MFKDSVDKISKILDAVIVFRHQRAEMRHKCCNVTHSCKHKIHSEESFIVYNNMLV